AHGGLEAGKGKVRPRLPLKRTRKGEARGIASFGSLLHARTSGIGQAEELGRLVESLAESVVYRGRPACVAADAGYEHDLRMPSRYEEEQIGKFDTVGQAGGQCMAFQMVDRQERLTGRRGDRLCGRQPDDEAADQAGAR